LRVNAGEHIGPEPLPPGESRTAPPRLDESTLFFLNIATIALVAGSIALIGIIPVLAPEQTLRVLTPGAIILVVGGARYLLFRGRTKAAVAVLALGTWLVATAGAAFMGGVRSTIIVAYPLIIIFTGWMMGARAAVVMTALSIAAFLGFALAEWTAIAPPWPPTPLAMYWLIQAVVLSLSAATIVYLRRSHHRQVEEVRALTAELTRQRAEAAAAETFRRNQDLLDRTGRLAHVGGWEVDVATRALNWTTETFRIHDLLPGSMPSVDQALAYYPPESRRVLEAAVEKALAEGTGYDLELPLDTASGRHIWVRTIVRAAVRGGQGGAPERRLAGHHAHRAADQALKDSLNNLQRTLEATDEGIFGYDGHDPGGKLLFANDRFFEIWNIPPEAARQHRPRRDHRRRAQALPRSRCRRQAHQAKSWRLAWCMRTRCCSMTGACFSAAAFRCWLAARYRASGASATSPPRSAPRPNSSPAATRHSGQTRRKANSSRA
jgi:PAS domain-containing protein